MIYALVFLVFGLLGFSDMLVSVPLSHKLQLVCVLFSPICKVACVNVHMSLSDQLINDLSDHVFIKVEPVTFFCFHRKTKRNLGFETSPGTRIK